MNLSQIPLFRGVSDKELEEMNRNGMMRPMHFEKNEVIFHMGDAVSETGIVISGSVRIENIDLWGNRSILSHIPSGHVFGETYALCEEPLMVSAVAAEPSEILFLNLRKAVGTGQNALLQNLLLISMQKNLALSSRIFCTTPKTIRERLLVYLTAQAVRHKNTSFEIPFNRQELADYLNLDRSALSKELGRMRDEGILEFRKNKFVLHKNYN